MTGQRGPLIVFACGLLLCACGKSQQDTDATAAVAPSISASDLQTLESAAFGFRLDYPHDWATRRDFKSSYLADGKWKTYAGSGSRGTPVAALVVPGSNDITHAELRIGVSRTPMEIRACSTPPSSARTGSVARQRINDADFATFEASDAAMSHSLEVHSYRTVHDGACYAIDLLVFGTNPQVYAPPATPPFSREQAFARMRSVIATFRFMH